MNRDQERSEMNAHDRILEWCRAEGSSIAPVGMRITGPNDQCSVQYLGWVSEPILFTGADWDEILHDMLAAGKAL